MDTLADRTLTHVWAQQPDLAVEAGELPPVPWEDPTAAGRTAALAATEELTAEWRSAGAGLEGAAAVHHLRATACGIEDFGPGVLNHMTGPVSRLSWAAQSWPTARDPDGEAYRERLATFPEYCRRLLSALGEDPDAGRSAPVLAAFVAQGESFVAAHDDPAGGPLAIPLGRRAADLVAGVLDAIGELVTAARTLRRGAVSASTLPADPSGAERYVRAAYVGTSTDLAPAAVAEIGITLLHESAARYEELLAAGVTEMPAIESPDELLRAFERTHEKLTATVPVLVSRMPAMPCKVLPMPVEQAAVGPPAFYGPSSVANRRSGSLYVNTARPTEIRPWEVLPLAMHEGVPGHHLQIALLDEAADVPPLLRQLHVNAFTEGWAVRAETLAPLLGLDLTPVEEFGLLTHQRWRAARLVVDVGLHVHGWPVERAVDFMRAATTQGPAVVTKEVVRYLAWPGQALGYAVGAAALGRWIDGQVSAGGDLAAVHSWLLERGSIPLGVLDGTRAAV